MKGQLSTATRARPFASTRSTSSSTRAPPRPTRWRPISVERDSARATFIWPKRSPAHERSAFTSKPERVQRARAVTPRAGDNRNVA